MSSLQDTVQEQIKILKRLRDEIRLNLHLASLEAKKEWQESLEPKLEKLEAEVSHQRENISEATNRFVKDLTKAFERMKERLKS